ncbi:MAG: response regulator [Spirulina sp. SIO3F2]|nr:response regulator [Spirulina sp. SIO3F2]
MVKSNSLKKILIVEDNLAHIRLIQEVFKLSQSNYDLAITRNGMEALAYLQQDAPYNQAPRPDLILLDLNLPKKDGREVLAQVKADPRFKRIPIVVLSTSASQEDINRSYDLHANCYILKSKNFKGLSNMVQCLDEFWFKTVALATD